MASIFRRHRKLWMKFRDASGEIARKPTPYEVGQEDLAKRYAKRKEDNAAAKRAAGGEEPLTVKRYAEAWLKAREERGVRAAKRSDRSRLTRHVLPVLGHLLLEDVRDEHIRDLVHGIKKSPRTIHRVFETLRSMLSDAETEGKVERNPCIKLKRGTLPPKVDADPEWRSQATYTTGEIERLISSPEIPPERRVLCALKALAGLRHGEAAALRWRHYDQAAEPLGRLTIAVAYDSDALEEKSTKTEATRTVPVHPTLARLLATWKLAHWERIYGHAASADDYIVPTRTLRPVNKTDAARAFKEDLRQLGLRVEAGKKRSRGGHDVRSWFMTQLVEDGADSMLVDRFTHAAPKDVKSGYRRFSWATLCREMAKLHIEIRTPEVIELGTGQGTAERKARGRWRKLVTPPGLEPGISA